jgi:hypothetical protein
LDGDPLSQIPGSAEYKDVQYAGLVDNHGNHIGIMEKMMDNHGKLYLIMIR